MEKFTHGVMVIDPKNPNEDGTIPVIHFVGYWSEPSGDDVYALYEEFKTDEELGLTETIDELEIVRATPDALEYFNNLNFEDHEDDN